MKKFLRCVNSIVRNEDQSICIANNGVLAEWFMHRSEIPDNVVRFHGAPHFFFKTNEMEQLDYLKPSLQKRQKRRDKRLDRELIECYRHGWRVNEKRAYKNKMKRNDYFLAKKTESMRSMYRVKKHLMITCSRWNVF
jgi:hypothetical protein